jgi:diguanylate cyclase (GGDEF)-like protein
VAELIESFRTQRFTAPEGGFFQLSFSAGVAAFPSDASTVADLYRVADEALYAAKKAGRSRVLPAASLPAAALAR